MVTGIGLGPTVAFGSVGGCMVVGAVAFAKISASLCSACRELSVKVGIGEAPGFDWRALIKSWAAAVAASAAVAPGMVK